MTGNIQLLPNSQVIAETYLPPNQNTTFNAPTADYTEGVALYVVNNSTFSTATVVVNITSNGNRVYTNSYFLPAQNGSMLVNLANLNDSTITISIYGSNDCYGYLVYNSNFILEISNAFSINNSMFPNTSPTILTTTDSVSAIIEDFLNNNTSILTDILYVSSNVDSLSAIALTDIDNISSQQQTNVLNISSLYNQQENHTLEIATLSSDVDHIDSNIQYISSEVTDNLNNVSILFSNVANIDTNINNLSSQQHTDILNISSLSSDVEVITTNIYNISDIQITNLTNISDLFKDVNTIDSNISSLSSEQIIHTTQIKSLFNDVSNIDTNIISLSSDIDNTNSSLTNGTLTPRFSLIERNSSQDSQNYLPNSSFLYQYTNWEIPFSGIIIANDANNTYLQYNGNDSSVQYYNSDKITANWIQSGSTCTLSGWIYNTGSTGDASIAISCFDSSGNYISSICLSNLPSGEAWTYVSSSGAFPADTASVQISLGFQGSSSGSNVAFTRLKFEAGEVATLWSDEATTTLISNEVTIIDSNVASLSSQQNTDMSNIDIMSSNISSISSALSEVESVISTGNSSTTNSPTSGIVESFTLHNGSYKANIYYLNGYQNESNSNQTLSFPLAYSYPPIIKNFAINSSSSPKSISVTTTGISLLSSDTTTYTGYIQIEGF